MPEVSKENMIKPRANEIDIFEIIGNIWASRKFILKIVGIFFIIGIIVAFGSPREYRSEMTLLVETNNTGGVMSGLLQQFGGLAGINLDAANHEEALTPQLYPDIIKSTPFLLELMNHKVFENKNNRLITIEEYISDYTRPTILEIIKKNTIGLPGKIKKLLIKNRNEKLQSDKLNGTLRLTQKQFDVGRSLEQRIIAKEGKYPETLHISVIMQDPVLAAQMNDSVVKSLTRYIIDYRTQKAKNDYEFILERYEEAKSKYLLEQRQLADFRDQNRNIILSSKSSEEDRLQAEYNIAFNLFNALSQQLEQAKIKVQEKTPVFKVLDPAKVPLTSFNSRVVTIALIMFLGIVIGIILHFSKHFIRKLGLNYNE